MDDSETYCRRTVNLCYWHFAVDWRQQILSSRAYEDRASQVDEPSRNKYPDNKVTMTNEYQN